jgi:fibronectin type 3 domain-containing protein
VAAQINLTWSAPTPDGTTTSIAAQYVVYRGFSSNGPFSVLFTTPNASQTSYSDIALPGAVSYYYEIAALNSTGGQGNPSSPVAGSTALSTINDLSTTPGVTTTSIPMSWSFVGGANAYQVYAGVQGGPYALVASVTGFVHTYVARNLNPGTAHSYLVKSRNGTAWSNYSNELLAGTTANAPTGLTAALVGSSVTLHWTPTAAGQDITAYRVYRSSVSGGPYTQVGSVAATASTYAETPPANQALYYVIDNYGLGGPSAKSAEAGLCTNVSCSAPPACHTGTGATCSPVTGVCSYPILADNTSCTDGNRCNGLEVCTAGQCVVQAGTVITCNAPQACQSAVGAICDTFSGACTYPPTPLVGGWAGGVPQ